MRAVPNSSDREIRVFSGIQPTGDLHIGNLLGAIRHWVTMQQEARCYYCVVDLHAITTPQEPRELRARSREVAALLLAAGVDHERSVLFLQSQVPPHAELAWILNCVTPYGWLARMIQFKEKSGRERQETSAGLFVYPVLMASDILLYQGHQVPVGDDQRQHLELARDVASRFNRLFGETFVIPSPRIDDVGARIMGLDDPTRKMSKSEEGLGHRINLLDTPDTIRRKIQRATTDSGRGVRFDPERPGITNLLNIYRAFTGESEDAIEACFVGKGYAELKAAVADATIEGLRPLRERYVVFDRDPRQLDAILAQGAERARAVAGPTLALAKEALGLG